ncbi:MAG: hypothetical protein H8K07_20405 [Nitrospira sp.]|nr:hypothetical protein [Nitrospira sp.]
MEQRYHSGQSLNDIAKHYNCTRQYIYKLMTYYGIGRRTNKEARILAIQQGKVSYALGDSSSGSSIVLQRRVIDESFFKTWTPEMAWVLGVIYTDGCLGKPNRISKYHLRIDQKEPELLEKVLVHLKSNAKISFSPRRGIAGALYTIRINNSEIYTDLQRLGLTPAKSLTLQFPSIPSPYVRHFIRGCWDGDGSIYLERGHIPSASYVSGSKDFIERFVGHLVHLGLQDRTVYNTVRSKNPSYYIRYTRPQCVELFHVLYDGVDASMYLSRKHDCFKRICDGWDPVTRAFTNV